MDNDTQIIADESWCLLTARTTYFISDVVHDMIREELSKFKSEMNHIIEFEDRSGGQVEVTIGSIHEMFYSTPETRRRDRMLWKHFRGERLGGDMFDDEP